MKILIIDDDHRNIFALRTALKSRGIEASGCQSAIEGLELLNTEMEIDVVLLDMMMPEFDGFQFLDRLHRPSGRVYPPVISVTARAMKGDRERCLLGGASGYVAKPVDIDELLEEIRSVISRK
ncbi:response regulator [Sphingobacterium daejeonense]|uniref:response regulator n=1 Tax=Sphingobacterium daejeonense TaxID=371142 RepID=UPI0010C5B369|nr:response regulator [Sphingobacterium daejeonense]VTQ07570.1 Polar-differentiation response regulator divK [Sphingobacterium daejeonense]